MMTFLEYVKQFRDDDTAEGDFAEDWIFDMEGIQPKRGGAPVVRPEYYGVRSGRRPTIRGPKSFEKYMRSFKASEEAIKAGLTLINKWRGL
jgi:hypothetical protein